MKKQNNLNLSYQDIFLILSHIHIFRDKFCILNLHWTKKDAGPNVNHLIVVTGFPSLPFLELRIVFVKCLKHVPKLNQIGYLCQVKRNANMIQNLVSTSQKTKVLLQCCLNFIFDRNNNSSDNRLFEFYYSQNTCCYWKTL